VFLGEWSLHFAATNFQSGGGPTSIVNTLEKVVLEECDHQHSARVRSPELRSFDSVRIALDGSQNRGYN
jgi:hypothetical protein